MSKSRHVVILGNGISGVTCARNLRKLDSDVKITLVSGESTYFFFSNGPDVRLYGAHEV
jgi:NADH dehydrogenase FAD-containing subunit